MPRRSPRRSSVTRAVAVTLAVTMLGGCYSNRALTTRVSPEFAVAEMRVPGNDGRARVAAVVLDNGSEVEFVEPVIAGPDGILRGSEQLGDDGGRGGTRPVEIPWERVRSAVLVKQERSFSWAKTLGLAAGVLVAAYAGFVAWVTAEEAKR